MGGLNEGAAAEVTPAGAAAMAEAAEVVRTQEHQIGTHYPPGNFKPFRCRVFYESPFVIPPSAYPGTPAQAFTICTWVDGLMLPQTEHFFVLDVGTQWIWIAKSRVIRVEVGKEEVSQDGHNPTEKGR